MHKVQVPYKNFLGQAKTKQLHFNLTEAEVFKLLPELRAIFEWHESLEGDVRELSTEEVKEFYTNFEEILLTAYGTLSADGEHFRKVDRYEFAESACFSALMVQLITDPSETAELLKNVMPTGLDEVVKKADANLLAAAQQTENEAQRAEIERLRAQLSATAKENL